MHFDDLIERTRSGHFAAYHPVTRLRIGIYDAWRQAMAAISEAAIKVNQTLTMHLFGRTERVRVLAVHRAGTIDVERLSDGKCFRVSGL